MEKERFSQFKTALVDYKYACKDEKVKEIIDSVLDVMYLYQDEVLDVDNKSEENKEDSTCRLRIYNIQESKDVLIKKVSEKDTKDKVRILQSLGYYIPTSDSEISTDLALIDEELPYGKRSIYVRFNYNEESPNEEKILKEKETLEENEEEFNYRIDTLGGITYIVKPHPSVPHSLFVRLWRI